MLVAWRAFTSAMTRPMSFIDDAPGLGDDRADRGARFGFVHLLRQEASSAAISARLGRGQFGAVAGVVQLGRIRGAA